MRMGVVRVGCGRVWDGKGCGWVGEAVNGRWVNGVGEVECGEWGSTKWGGCALV